MKVKINNQSFSKTNLLIRIKESKIQAIKYLIKNTNITLKDAHEIIENISDNPDYYDGINIVKSSKSKPIQKQNNNLKTKLQFIDKTNANHQLYLGFALLFVVLLVLFLFNFH